MRLKRMITFLLAAMLLLPVTGAQAYDFSRGGVLASYESPTLKYTLRRYVLNTQVCHVIDLWLAEPARQIRKAASPWHVSLAEVLTMAETVPGTVLAINGSGYVSPRYPDIPQSYPGESSDYWYEPLGSVTVTNGDTLRCLDGIPFTGLTLEENGLNMIIGTDPEDVLARSPSETWSFYDGCPLIRDGKILLDMEWEFACKRAKRNVIAETRDGHYLIFMVMDTPGVKLTDLTRCLADNFDILWAYNLDGGPSAALVRRQGTRLKLVAGGTQQVVDIIAFTE